MGKFGPRLNSRKKAKRWPKGQSSNSNPETTKHREKAAGMFFREFTGTPAITKEALQKHDAIQGIQPHFQNLELNDDNEESTIDGTINTFDTFASSYSNCSNISFNRFLSHFQSNSLIHKEMLAILSAVTEIIKQNGGNESSTEYFGALMSTLEAVDSSTTVAATLSLLGMGLKTVPKNVLIAQFGQASKIFLQILTNYAATEEFLILRHCIGCLSVLLRAQEAAAWTNASTIQVLDAILSFTIYSKPRVRKSAQHGICAILKGSDIMRSENAPPYHPGAPQVAKHCITQLEEVSKPGGITSILHTLTLLKDIMHQLPKSHVKTICEGLLSIMALKNVLVTSCCLQTLHGLFISRPSETILPSETNAQIISALYDYQPPANDAQPTLAWLAVMQEAYCNLSQNSIHLSAAIIPRIFDKCIELWLSDKPQVISGTSHTIKTLLQDCVSPLCENEEQIRKYSATIDQVISVIHKAMSYQYVDVWSHVFHITAVLFQVTGKTEFPRLIKIINSLAELRDSHNFSYKSDAEYAVGAAIKAMGPGAVLQTIPLVNNDDTINFQRGWLLPLLKDCITHGSLSFFINVLLPMVEICEKKLNEPMVGKSYEFLLPQIWAILPSLCNNASDVKENFKTMAKMLGMKINDQKDVRSCVMAALRKLITKATDSHNEEDTAELSRYAKNYLPLLFNLYTTKPNGTDEEGQRLAAFDTIKVYLTVTSQELANELFDRALSRLKEPNVEDFFKESVYDLIRILIKYTDISRLKIFYDKCVPFLKNKSKQKEQKKAYRFLEEVISSDKLVCKDFVLQHRPEIKKILISTAPTVAKPSKGARLRCFIHLIKTHLQLKEIKFLQVVVQEAVSCVKELNERCRASAYCLLNTIAEKLLGNPEDFKNYSNMLINGMNGAENYKSATLLALASITYHYNGSLGIETIKEVLGHACTLVVTPTREVVESALAYIKVYITVMPSPIVASTLNDIVSVLSHMDEDCKRHFRQKVRDIFTKLIRKYSYEVVFGMIPNSDKILQKRLKNIHKVEQTKKKNRELKKLKQSENDDDHEFDAKRRPKSMEEILADSDEEFEATEHEENKKNNKRKSRKEAWIQENEENIIDLTDPTAARNITTTQPEVPQPKVPIKKPKDHGFKTAPDGRIIITDNNDKDSDTEVTIKKKSYLHSDSEDDYENEDEDVISIVTSKSKTRKRKHSESTDAISLRSYSTSKYRTGGTGIHRPVKSIKIDQAPGAEYRARKAKGDIRKKGKLEPYAYLPLKPNKTKKSRPKRAVYESVMAKARTRVLESMKKS